MKTVLLPSRVLVRSPCRELRCRKQPKWGEKKSTNYLVWAGCREEHEPSVSAPFLLESPLQASASAARG